MAQRVQHGRRVGDTATRSAKRSDCAKPKNCETGTLSCKTADSTPGARGWFLAGADVPDEGESLRGSENAPPTPPITTARSVATVAPLALSLLLPHEFIRLAAVPIGGALVWLGYALWSEQRAKVSEPLARTSSAQLRPAGAE